MMLLLSLVLAANAAESTERFPELELPNPDTNYTHIAKALERDAPRDCAIVLGLLRQQNELLRAQRNQAQSSLNELLPLREEVAKLRQENAKHVKSLESVVPQLMRHARGKAVRDVPVGYDQASNTWKVEQWRAAQANMAAMAAAHAGKANGAVSAEIVAPRDDTHTTQHQALAATLKGHGCPGCSKIVTSHDEYQKDVTLGTYWHRACFDQHKNQAIREHAAPEAPVEQPQVPVPWMIVAGNNGPIAQREQPVMPRPIYARG